VSFDELLTDAGRMARLLALEKARRGADRLVFVGASNVASVRWCPMQAVLKSIIDEPMFFAVYLHDRLLYARLLGLIDDLPSTDEGLLDAGGDSRSRYLGGQLLRCRSPRLTSTGPSSIGPASVSSSTSSRRA
jgi:hypothetical protein